MYEICMRSERFFRTAVVTADERGMQISSGKRNFNAGWISFLSQALIRQKGPFCIVSKETDLERISVDLLNNNEK